MCHGCADHNIRNRGAVHLVPVAVPVIETEADHAEEREVAEHNEWKATKRAAL
jgi:hypothetical protein